MRRRGSLVPEGIQEVVNGGEKDREDGELEALFEFESNSGFEYIYL